MNYLYKVRKISPVILLSIILATSLNSAYAESEDSSEFPFVVTGDHLSQPLSISPNSITVIDHDMIVASGFRLIPDLFKLVPGMTVSYYRGHTAIVAYHGSTDQFARKMNVMIDGLSIYSAPLNTVDWALLPITIDDIARIEIRRGPSASTYGPNSTQGVINIITKASSGESAHLSVRRGEKGINDVAIAITDADENYSHRISMAYASDHGYDALTTPPNGLSGAEADKLLNNSNDDNRSRLFNYRADYYLDASDKFDIRFGYMRNMRGVGFNANDPTPANPNSVNGNTFHDVIGSYKYAQAGWNRRLSDDSTSYLRYGYSEKHQSETFPVYFPVYPLGTFENTPLTNQSTTIIKHDISWEKTSNPTNLNRLVYGFRYGREEVGGQADVPVFPIAYSSSFLREDYQIFAHNEWQATPRWLLNTGAMYERNSMHQEYVSPSIALTFNLTPDQHFRVGSSIAYRTPSLTEERVRIIAHPTLPFSSFPPGVLLIPDQDVTSPNLISERTISYELSYLGYFDDFSADVRLYSEQGTNGLLPTRQGSTVAFVNALSTLMQGIEGALKYAPSKTDVMSFNFNRSRGISNAIELSTLELFSAGVGGFNSNIDGFSASRPSYIASVHYAHHFSQGGLFSANYYQQGASQPFYRAEIDYQPTQRRTDMMISTGFSLGSNLDGDVSLVVQNIFNQDYTEHISSNLFNQRIYVALGIDL
jgi:iron complex outermembrane receptor protein